jgi:peptide alpha-N-acetyltransferase
MASIDHDEQDGDVSTKIEGIDFVDYRDESLLDSVMSLVGRDLSEPYSSKMDYRNTYRIHHSFSSALIVVSQHIHVPVFTYRYFLHRFPELCILAVNKDNPEEPIGCVVAKMDWEEVTDGNGKLVKVQTGYIGMLAVNKTHRRLGIGTCLIKKILKRMQIMGCASVTLETEVSNKAAQKLYQDSFGFMREELLVRYYLNWGDAYRLRLWFA